jgi:hypothetical protein
MAGVCCSMLKRLERRMALRIDGDDFTVQDGLCRVQSLAGLDDGGYAFVRSLSFLDRMRTLSPSFKSNAR